MKAVISRPYACAPEGHTVVRFEPGTEVDGIVAELALAAGAALEVRMIEPLETKLEVAADVKEPPRKKARKG